MAKAAKALTKTRHKTHGKFEDVATTSSALFGVMQTTKNWAHLSVQRQEAIKMIVHKLGRIGAGNPDEPDHWDDIGGYAELGKNDGQFAGRRKAAKPRAPARANLKKAKPPKAKEPAKKRVAKKAARPARGRVNRPETIRAPAPRRPRAARAAQVNEAPAQTAEA